MKEDYTLLLQKSKDKTLSAISLVEASLTGLPEYNSQKQYTPKELEPYDALSDRFIRAVESCIKFFKTYEYYLYTSASDTYRDLLLNMEKANVISSLDEWVDMRDIRNRIVHGYLPEQIQNIYDLIMGKFKDELAKAKRAIQAL